MLIGSQNRRKSLLVNCPNLVEKLHLNDDSYKLIVAERAMSIEKHILECRATRESVRV